MMLKYKTGNGFTLLEMMLVLAVVGILVGIAMPAYKDRKSVV